MLNLKDKDANDRMIVQQALKVAGFYTGGVDGDFGPKSIKAAKAVISNSRFEKSVGYANWGPQRLFVGAFQALANEIGINAGAIDGLVGPQTSYAWQQFNDLTVSGRQNFWADEPEQVNPKLGPVSISGLRINDWPKQNEAAMIDFYGPRGQNQVKVPVPFPMKLAWDLKVTVRQITIHEKCASSLTRILDAINQRFTTKQIADLGINLFGGSLNVRLMRGSKTKWSIHSWGAAIDFDPERNALKTHAPEARLSQNDARPFWEIWEAEGWTSLGRQQDRDYMHIQAADL